MSPPELPDLSTAEEWDEFLAELDQLAIEQSPATFAQCISRADAEPWYPYRHLLYINQKLVELATGKITRLMITVPPRHGKTWLCSVNFPAWYLNRWPERRIILASYGDDFAAKWGRQTRDLIASHPELLHIRIDDTSKAADRWDLQGAAGGMKTAGVGGQITGLGAHLFIIDDPVKDAVDASSATMRDRAWEWWQRTASTRLQPITSGGKRIQDPSLLLIQCMTGDTPVLMAIGNEKLLRDIRPGDRVATYDDGRVSVSTVRNWANNGPDRVFAIRMKSGTVVRANARHPFLVEMNGEVEWRRTDSLRRGSVILKVIGASGGESSAQPKDASCPPSARACVPPTTASSDGRQAFDPHRSTPSRAGMRTFGIGTGSIRLNTTVYLPSRAGSARFANSHQPQRTLVRIGVASSASTIATTAGPSGDFFATTAISRSDTGRPQSCYALPLRISKDTVLEVVDAGVEDVFDIEIEGTENFIANGLVSHNTRWHEDDLAGRFLEQDALKAPDDPTRWTIVNLPALAEDNDILGRVPGTALCPEIFNENALALIQSDDAVGQSGFAALYQQRPQPEGGGSFKKTDFRYWTPTPAAQKTYVLHDTDGALLVPQAECWRMVIMDLALSEKQTADFTVAAIFDVASWLEPTRMILVDLIRERITGAGHVDLGKRIWDEYRPNFVGVEEAQQGSMTLAFLRRMGVLIRPLKHKARSKPFRAKDAELLIENHRVYFPRSASWLTAFEHELLLFPTGAHDDQVDVLAYAAHELLRGINLSTKPKIEEDRSLEARIHKQIAGRHTVEHPVLGRIY